MITMLRAQLASNPDAIALADHSGALTWQELASRAAAWRSTLATAGLKTGDTVGILLTNRREVFEVLLGCLHSGITVVPINTHLTEPEVAYILKDSGASALVTDRTDITGLPIFDPAKPVQGKDPGEPVCGQLMVYTSGTTGAPKGVLNGLFTLGDPFDRIERMLNYAGRLLDVPNDGRVLLVGPWYHSAQLFFALMSLLRGSTLIVRERFDAEPILTVLQQERITHCHLVPTQFVRFLRLPSAVKESFDPSALRTIWHGGAACPQDVKRLMIEWWGPVITEYYGASEGGAVTLISAEEWVKRPGSVGRPIPPNDILIVDEDGNELGPNQTGRVYMRRPGRGFQYHNAEDKTRAAHLRPGVFTYGEIGHVDTDGYLFLTGRAQDMIISGGVNVYPAEVEAVLLRHPAVRDAAVIGTPDDEFGERVAAVVELESPVPFSELDVHCRSSLAGFKVPRQYRVVDSLTRESTGKIRKDLLRDLLAAHPEEGTGA
ncbi:AMP-binding protein [Catelliglobosispora koreensis]|uniref:AMP-binding protein n=1 Tax=Catelliglobosispora koreensis TaxID=129052 RepID=UPI00036115AE|nr:AMP-binding protein [Catelliglobosispora koreensis]